MSQNVECWYRYDIFEILELKPYRPTTSSTKIGFSTLKVVGSWFLYGMRDTLFLEIN